MTKILIDEAVVRQALEALKLAQPEVQLGEVSNAITALRRALEQPVQDNTYGYAKSLAEAIFKQHFASDEHYASGRVVWGVNDTVIGILTQIDNMVADMVRRPEQPAQQDIPDLIAGALGVSRGTAYDLMREALGEPEQPAQQEPVARMDEIWASENGHEIPGKTELYAEFFNEPPPKGTLLYTSLQARVPLTPTQVNSMVEKHGIDGDARHWYVIGLVDGEAAHGIGEKK